MAPSSETLRWTLCGRGKTSQRARSSRRSRILGRIEGIAASEFRLFLSDRCDPVVPAIKPFAPLYDLGRELALQPVDLAGKYGDLGASFALHRIEPRLETFKGRGLLCVQALGGVHSLDSGFEGADFVGHLVHCADDLGALTARLWPVDCGGLRCPRGKRQLAPGKIRARHTCKAYEAGR